MTRISSTFNTTGSVTARMANTQPNLSFISPTTGTRTSALLKSFTITIDKRKARNAGQLAAYEAFYGAAKKKARRTAPAKLSRLIHSLGIGSILILERNARGTYEIVARPIEWMQQQNEPCYSLRTMLALMATSELHVHESDEDGRPLVLSSEEP